MYPCLLPLTMVKILVPTFEFAGIISLAGSDTTKWYVT